MREVSGITVSSATYSGHALAKGIFSDASGDGLGIDTGIILCTGLADQVGGWNYYNDTSTPLHPFGIDDPGDDDLKLIANYGTNKDAAVLEFDFTTSAGEVAFKFVFASEEYLEYVGTSYNDAFAFFIDGQNIALVPNTTDPITINRINTNSNSQYYRDNPRNSGNVNIIFDGLTVVITVSKVVSPNVSHHVKLAIADTADELLDAAVFIAALIPCPAPTVSIQAIDHQSAEDEFNPGNSPDKGRFLISRTGALDCPLTVNLSISGTATYGYPGDYMLALDGTSVFVSSPVTIPAGSASLALDVWPWYDGYGDGGETVNVHLGATGGAYTIGSPSSATVFILEM